MVGTPLTREDLEGLATVLASALVAGVGATSVTVIVGRRRRGSNGSPPRPSIVSERMEWMLERAKERHDDLETAMALNMKSLSEKLDSANATLREIRDLLREQKTRDEERHKGIH